MFVNIYIKRRPADTYNKCWTKRKQFWIQYRVELTNKICNNQDMRRGGKLNGLATNILSKIKK